MLERHVTPEMLADKVVDIHSHVGVSLQALAKQEYPFAQSIEDIYYRQLSGPVDVNVVFPFTADLFFDPHRLCHGELVPAATPLSAAPFVSENRMLMMSIFTFCPELKDRFIPFVQIDPGRMVSEQIAELEALEKEFPIYGIKVNPVMIQSPVSAFFGEASMFLDFARERDLPFLFHMSADMKDAYGSPKDTFRLAEENTDLRFCLAHCINFDRELLRRAGELPNIWFDTSAVGLQTQMIQRGMPSRPTHLRFDTDYSDPSKAVRALAEAYPGKIIWGTDSPAYTYICKRKQGEHTVEFKLKCSYEDEVAILHALPEPLRSQACNHNSIRFMFGRLPIKIGALLT